MGTFPKKGPSSQNKFCCSLFVLNLFCFLFQIDFASVQIDMTLFLEMPPIPWRPLLGKFKLSYWFPKRTVIWISEVYCLPLYQRQKFLSEIARMCQKPCYNPNQSIVFNISKTQNGHKQGLFICSIIQTFIIYIGFCPWAT